MTSALLIAILLSLVGAVLGIVSLVHSSSASKVAVASQATIASLSGRIASNLALASSANSLAGSASTTATGAQSVANQADTAVSSVDSQLASLQSVITTIQATLDVLQEDVKMTLNPIQMLHPTLSTYTIGSAPSSIVPGTIYVSAITQDSVGGWSYTFPTAFRGATPASLTPGSSTIQLFVSLDSSTLVPISPATILPA
jgi:hypothetical protein